MLPEAGMVVLVLRGLVGGSERENILYFGREVRKEKSALEWKRKTGGGKITNGNCREGFLTLTNTVLIPMKWAHVR